MELCLRVERLNGRAVHNGAEAAFDGRGGSIGRTSDNFMVLADPERQISSRHAFVLLRDEQFYIVDTGQNGIYLNDSNEPLGWCRTAEIGDGDRVRIGGYVLRARVWEGSASSIDLSIDRSAGVPEFPVPTEVIPEAPTPEPEAEPQTEPETAPPSEPSADVLVVDDDEEISFFVKFMLERAGYSVRVAKDGLAAREAIEKTAPTRLVVLDIMLPHIDGFQLIGEFQSNPNWRHVPVVMLSAMSDERDIVRALDAGANDYVAKPFKPAELVARLGRLLD